MQLHRRRFLRSTACACGLPLLAGMGALAGCSSLPTTPSPTASSNASPAARRLHDIFRRHWEATARLAPEWATFRGDHRFGGELAQVGASAEAERRRLLEGFVAEVEALSPQPLDPSDRLSREMFLYNLRNQLAVARFEAYRGMSIGALRGPHTLMSGLLQQQPVDTEVQREQLIARLAQHPRRLEQEITQLRRSMQLGWVPARAVLQRAVAQIEGQLKADLDSGPFGEPWRRLPRDLNERQADAWRERGRAAVSRDVLPPLERLRRFILEELLPRAPDSGSLMRYPGGVEVYEELVRQSTTTRRSAREIHEIGLAELDRLHEQFARLQATMGLRGGFADAVQALRAPEHFYASPQAMLAGYRAVAKELDPLMPRLFIEQPRAPYGIRPMAEHLGPGAADNYTAPPADGSGPGWYNANIQAWQRRPKWALPTLVAHETVPGHHTQNARARELRDLPDFRRQGFYTAFGEGWALYAERLMDEIGFYEKPADRWGFLQAQAFRAARLVVDTGIHAMGWTRQQALQTMLDRVGEAEVFMSAEVDRYTSTPAQALAYMVGQLHILDEREKVRRALGTRFDLRRFNNAVIDQGAVPLEVLSGQLADWATATATASASATASG